MRVFFEIDSMLNLINDNNMNLTGLNIFHQFLKGRTLHTAAGVPAIIIIIINCDPPLCLLT